MIILGGASRAGKGIISRQLMTRLNLPYLSVDPLKMALIRAVPQYPVDPNAGSVEVSRQLWPYLSTLMSNLVETGVEYIIEGEILPEHAAQFLNAGEQKITVCFVGYCDISNEEKVKSIKHNSGFPNDWTVDCSDDEIIDLVEESIEYSQFLKKECQSLGLKYIDTGVDFEGSISEVINFIEQQHRSE